MFFFQFQLEDYETKMTVYAEKIIKMTAEIEKMEKNPDAYTDADMDEMKVEIKQVEALIKELQLSIRGSTIVFESLHVQVSPGVGHRLSQIDVTLIHLQNRVFPLRSQPWWQP